METFSALLAICAGKFTGLGEFHAQRPVTRSFDVFFDLPMNKRLSKHSWGWWLDTPSCPLWRQRNVAGEPLVTGGFPLQKSSIVELWFLLMLSHGDPLNKRRVALIWDVNVLMWRHCKMRISNVCYLVTDSALLTLILYLQTTITTPGLCWYKIVLSPLPEHNR